MLTSADFDPPSASRSHSGAPSLCVPFSRPRSGLGVEAQRGGVSFWGPSPDTRSSGFLTPLTGGPSRCADAEQHSGKGHATRQPHNPGNADACAPVPQNRLAAPRPPLHSLEVQGSRGQPPTHPVAMLYRLLMRCAVPPTVAALRPMAGVQAGVIGSAAKLIRCQPATVNPSQEFENHPSLRLAGKSVRPARLHG